MKTVRPFAFTSFVVFGVLVACGGSGGGFTGGDAGVGTLVDAPTGVAVLDTGAGQTFDSFVAPVDTGAGTGTGSSPEASAPSGQCAPNCTADSDCQASCPAVAGALNCCDVSSGVCFTSSEAACPDVDSGPAPMGDAAMSGI